MGISFGSIGTGLPKDIVQQIVQAEAIPVKQMEARKAKIENKKQLVEQLIALMEKTKGELLQNKSARSLRELAVNTNDQIVAVTTDKNIAETGNHQLEVLELAQKSSAITNGFPDKDKTYTGVGYISYELPNGDTKEIYVDKDNATLAGIAKLINQSNSGMKANVIEDGKESKNKFKLMISLDNTGDSNKAVFPDFYFVDGEEDLYIDHERPAQNAKIKLNGFEMEVPANKIADLLPGVTVDLKKAQPGEEFSIEIKEDSQKVTTKFSGIIETLNGVLKFIKDQNTLNEKSDTSQTLGGDITLQTIEGKIRSAVFMPVMTSAGAKRISDIGVSFTRQGMLQYDPAKFESVAASNYKMVTEVLTGIFTSSGGKTNGFIDNIYQAIDSALVTPNGTLQSRKRGLNQNIAQIDQQISNKQRHLQQREQSLKDKFARLEETMSKIKGQGSGLAGFAGGASPIQQLG